MSGNKNSIPFVRIQTAHQKLPEGRKRRVDISIEHHISENTYFLIASLPKAGYDYLIINQTQAESLIKIFKIDIINVR